MKKILRSAVMALIYTIFVGLTQVDGAEIIQAANCGNLARVEQELAKGVDVNIADQWGNTALMCAARWGHAPVVEALLTRGADVNHANTEHGCTALMLAVFNRHEPVVEALLPHLQIDGVLAVNNDRKTALDLAMNEDKDIKKLIQNRINEIRGSKTKSAAKVA